VAQDNITKETRDAARIISLDRTDKRNAMTVDMMWALAAALDEAEADKGVRAVIITGQGGCFSAGVDFMSLAQLSQQMPTTQDFRHFLYRFQDVFTRMERMEKPVIAAVHEYCLGMAWELALAADFRVAAKGTVFGLPEVQLGLIPDVGGTSRLTRLAGEARAKELVMLSRRIDADQAHAMGLVNDLCEKGDHLETALAMVGELKGCAPLAVGMAKKVINRGAHLDSATFRELEAFAQSTLLNTEDVKEGVMAKMQKRPPDFKGK
jgi:enoyl-CoA hydratase/carnithine racemase